MVRESKGSILERQKMLQSLSIRNVVLIDKLDIDFSSGLSVLTGETGAGKSILLDSLGLVLGARGDTSLIRQGEEKLTVVAEFDVPEATSELAIILSEYDIEFDDCIQIKRSIDINGKGKIFINDQPISLKLLKEIGIHLVEIHGQFDNQGLLNQSNHLSVLDSFGEYSDLLKEVKDNFVAYRDVYKQRELAERELAYAKEEEENLRHWIRELELANPYEGEVEELSQLRQTLMNSEKIIENLSYAYKNLTQNTDVVGAIRKAQSAIDKANTSVDGRFDDIVNMLDQALIDCNEVISQIEQSSQDLLSEENNIDTIETRLFLLKDLARKHHCDTTELCSIWQDFKNKLNQIEYGDEKLDVLRKEEEKRKLNYLSSANKLSQARKKAAQKLDSLVMDELPPLKMEKARFETIVEAKDEGAWSGLGNDNVYFTVSTNPNSPQGPLNKIASGGELSRFMLALKVNLASSSSVKTMIFDEIDAGVGGATARAVGERLARLAKDVQILVVTHSPQVASCGDNHFKVSKSTHNNITTTNVCELKSQEISEEIARMLAGETISEEARAAALALLKK